MLGADWKVKIDFLNPKSYFFISPQFYHRHIMDYAEGVPGVRYKLTDYSGNIRKDNYHVLNNDQYKLFSYQASTHGLLALRHDRSFQPV